MKYQGSKIGFRVYFNTIILASLLSILVSSNAQAAILKAIGEDGDWSDEFAGILDRGAGAGPHTTIEKIARGLARILEGIDPPAGTIYNGKVVIHYNPSLLSVDSTGWFGAFAADPTVPAPP